YDPQLGRYLEPDPLQAYPAFHLGSAVFPHAPEPYQYALNNPIKYSDSTGLGVEEEEAVAEFAGMKALDLYEEMYPELAEEIAEGDAVMGDEIAVAGDTPPDE